MPPDRRENNGKLAGNRACGLRGLRPGDLLSGMTAPASPAPAAPSGDVVIRTIAMPADTNNNGDIFGGWLVSQMDIGGAILARSTALSRVTTVAIDAISFLRPVVVGDIVTCYAQLLSIGRTSMKISIEAWVHRYAASQQQQVTRGCFTYVALDSEGKPHPVKR